VSNKEVFKKRDDINTKNIDNNISVNNIVVPNQPIQMKNPQLISAEERLRELRNKLNSMKPNK